MRFYLVATLALQFVANTGFTADLPTAPMPRVVKRIGATEIAITWQNKITYLPDVRNGGKIAGLTGQLYLFAPDYQAAPVKGKVTIEMFDESKPGESVKLGSWTLDKNTLAKLRLKDEQFGDCYSLFLPWPEYKAEITRVKLTMRYDPDRGPALFTRAMTFSIAPEPAP